VTVSKQIENDVQPIADYDVQCV